MCSRFRTEAQIKDPTITMLRPIVFMWSLSLTFAALQKTAQYKGTTLKFYYGQQDTTIFAGAILNCYDKGGWLVMPKYSNLNQAVAKVANGYEAWIGGSDIYGEGAFRWNDGEDVEWANWHPNEPNNHGNQDCIKTNFGGRAGIWDDDICEKFLGYVCQIPNEKASPQERSKFTVFTGQNATSYFQAKSICQNRRSRLALIEDVNTFEHRVPGIDGSSFAEYWVSQQQDVDSCGTISHDGISNARCLQALPFICEQVAPYGLSVSDEEATLEIGSNFNVECSASGFPTPEVKWYRHDVCVAHQKRGVAKSTLVLDNVNSEDDGMYVCKATNEVDGERSTTEGYFWLGITIILG